MDASLLMVDLEKEIIEWAGANNPLWIVDKTNNTVQLSEIKGNKQPIGKFDFIKPFTNHEIPLVKGNNYYMFSDGFSDQFGGLNRGAGGKKFSQKRLRELITSLSDVNVNEQEQKIENAFIEWKSEFEQIDDVLVAGISF
jgi:serine phosphatase RsbU (regulator of sigma subunit)